MPDTSIINVCDQVSASTLVCTDRISCHLLVPKQSLDPFMTVIIEVRVRVFRVIHRFKRLHPVLDIIQSSGIVLGKDKTSSACANTEDSVY